MIRCSLPYLGYLLLFFSTFVTRVAASEEANEILTRPSLNSSVWQMALGLLLVLAVIFLLTWLMRKVTGIQGIKGHIKIISAVNVGVKERAVLVEVGGEQLLLGVATGQVNLLHKFDEPVVTSPPDFAGSLHKASEKLSKKVTSEHKE